MKGHSGIYPHRVRLDSGYLSTLGSGSPELGSSSHDVGEESGAVIPQHASSSKAAPPGACPRQAAHRRAASATERRRRHLTESELLLQAAKQVALGP